MSKLMPKLKTKKFGIIYKAISPSGKVYIGQTIQNLSARKYYHYRVANYNGRHLYNLKIYRAIRKYGKQIIWSVEHDNIPVNKLDEVEINTIKKYDSYNNGYNGTLGGYGRAGNPLSEESRKKLSLKYCGSGNPFYNKKHSEETRNKMSKSSKGQKAWNKGIKHNTISKKKMSVAQKNIAEQKGKLTWRQVRAIRKKYNSGKYTYSELANEYSITKSNVGHIIRKRIWVEDD